MNRLAYLILGLCLVLMGCTTPKTDTIFQTSTIDALLAGVYDGDFTCRDLLKQGNLGTGTFNDLDGEMLIMDGKVYQIKSDGKIYEPDISIKTPFASICRFNPEMDFPIEPGSDFTTVQDLINAKAPNLNLFCSVRITGKFKAMRTRSVPRQNKPYPPLHIVTATQPEFGMENVSGTIVGFRLPSYMKGISIPGYHLHFLSSDLSFGGHIISFEIISGQCEIDVIHQLILRLPEDNAAFAATDLSKDRSLELKKVEGN